MAEAERQGAGRVREEDFHVGAFAHADVESFGDNFVLDLVVEDFQADMCAFPDVQYRVPEVVVALEHGHFICAFGNRPHHGARILCEREKCRKVRLVGDQFFKIGEACRCFRCRAGSSVFLRRDFCHGEECPQFVVAAGHAYLLYAGDCVHLYSSIQS